ncbi:MAG TPA: esterase-like activity of phytase family protein [Hyphomicrobiaceae bacterium]|nr:esterase-like activity of phytase family protein [Hyphomicrobiaceae bacterium]
MSYTQAPSRRTMLAGLAAGAGASLLLRTPATAETTAAGPITVAAQPISHFARGRPGIRRVGDLEFRGGLVLTSPSPSFGGWSALAMESTGSGLLAISDTGSWLTANIAYRDGTPVGLDDTRLGPLLGPDGQPSRSPRERDAESVALLEGDLSHGALIVGFERHHRIGRFAIRDRQVLAQTSTLALPPDARGMRANQGIEALTTLKAGPFKGSIVAFAERYTRGSGYHSGWMWVRGISQPIYLRDIGGYNITDAAGLPDGGLLVLERYFRWTAGLKIRIRRLRAEEIEPRARLTGRTVMEADLSYEIDNMEGLAVHRTPQGETIVSLISDDNFNHFFQRTILLQFALLDDGGHGTRETGAPRAGRAG